MKVSGIVVIKDEERTCMQALASFKGIADEILVADIGMPPKLREKVKALPRVRIIPIDEPVPYVERIRQKVIDQAKGEWVLLLDSDESVTKTLATHLEEHMDECDYMIIPRKNMILGQWMQHSRWWPDPQIRFFRKSAVTWGTVIHAQPNTSGTAYHVPHEEQLAIEHHNYLDYDQYLEKSHRYARAEAQGFIDRNEEMSILSALKKGMSEFSSRYFHDDGYKDGVQGFIMAFSQLLYYFQAYVYYWEMKGRPATPEKELQMIPAQFFTHALHESLHWSRVKGIVHDPVSKVKEAILRRL